MSVDLDVAREQGRVALQRGDLSGAEEAFARLASAPATRAVGDYGLALVADRRGHRLEATALMERVVAADPRHANALYYLGLWGEADDPAAAAVYLRRCLDVMPAHAGARSQLRSLSETGRRATRSTAPESRRVDREGPSPSHGEIRYGASTSAIPTTTIPTSVPSTAYRPAERELPPPGEALLRPPRPPGSWGNLVGFVVEMAERAEGRNTTAFGLRAYEFVIQGVDQAGRKTALESIEMRGAGRVGMISKGHWVEVDRSRPRGRAAATVNRLHNLTTGGDVSVRGVWSSASGRRGYYVIAPLLLAVLIGAGFWWVAARESGAVAGGSGGPDRVTVPTSRDRAPPPQLAG